MRATRRLERVHVDLTGPMSITSRSGYLYSMNIIDDFSGYPWTIPLKSKADAFSKLCAWELAVCAQSGEQIGIYVTDNGELKSSAIRDWCASHSTTHHFTAPHISAQNGRCECLHLTLMNKARSVSIACHAPPSFWDEFMATACYLSSLTASTSLHNHMPSELWFGHKPNLLHLREIGCSAYVLYEGNHPKIAPCSFPCILIGYEPNAKAYRCWHKPTNHIVTSFNVSFIESKDNSYKPLSRRHTLPTNHPSDDQDDDSILSQPEDCGDPNPNETQPNDCDNPPSQSVIVPPDEPQPDDRGSPPSPSVSPNPTPPAPPLRRSTCICFPTSRSTTSDGLAHTAALHSALHESTAAAARQEEQCNQSRTTADSPPHTSGCR
jgi:Integrase core domain